MPKLRLTPRTVTSLAAESAPQVDYYDEVLPGLVLRVGRGGSKVYLVRYRANGKYRRVRLGRHPVLGLADARDAARAVLSEATIGNDPALDREEKKSGEVTFAALCAEVLDAKADTTREATRRERQRIVEKELLPHWRDMPASSITRRDVVQLVERVARRGSPVMANRTLACIKTLFNTGLKRGFPTLDSSPATLVEPPRDEGSRGRYLDTSEIRTLWKVLEAEHIVARCLFRFTLLTAQRIGSVCALRWEDIDSADVWHIPAESFKGKRPHLVPLSAEALAVLEEVRMPRDDDTPYAFPGRSDGNVEHVSSTHKMLQRIRKRSGLPSWTVHDFRTTFRTHATRALRPSHRADPAGLGVLPNVADAVLGHKEASLGFDKYTAEPERYLLSEKRAALEAWGSFVLRCTKSAKR